MRTISTVFEGVEFNKIGVMKALESAYNNGERVRIWYGSNGNVWHEEYDVIGYVGRSGGSVKTPLLVYNKRSYGGGAILVDSVVKVVTTDGKVLYSDPEYSIPEYTAIGDEVWIENNAETYTGHGTSGYATLWARCESENHAERLAGFMSGKRFSK